MSRTAKLTNHQANILSTAIDGAVSVHVLLDDWRLGLDTKSEGALTNMLQRLHARGLLKEAGRGSFHITMAGRRALDAHEERENERSANERARREQNDAAFQALARDAASIMQNAERRKEEARATALRLLLEQTRAVWATVYDRADEAEHYPLTSEHRRLLADASTNLKMAAAKLDRVVARSLNSR